MRNHKQLKYKSTNLFCHREDEAFILLDRLEGIFAKMVASVGSRYLRDRLHRASARLAHIVIMTSDEERPEKVTARYEPAVLLCKVIDGLLKLLARYTVLALNDYEDAMKVARRLMKVIARRYFGVEVVASDDGSSSGSPPPESSSGPVGGGGGFDIAAERPPGTPADA